MTRRTDVAMQTVDVPAPEPRVSWREALAAEYEIAQAHLQDATEDVGEPGEYL